VCYEEGLYVGYRYFTSFGKPVAYPFGHGLSYTSFSLSDAQLEGPDTNGAVEVTVRVQNTGKIAGREVVQLYLSAPQGQLEKPVLELKGFAKTELLQPGDQQRLTIRLNARSLASYDPDHGAWVADSGTYTVHLCASSVDAQEPLRFQLDQPLLAARQPACLPPNRELTELQRKR
jgi:beta-glucosidase